MEGPLNTELRPGPAWLHWGPVAGAAGGESVLFLETDSEGEKHVFRRGTNSHLHVPSRAKFVPNESLGQKLRQPLAPAWGRAGCGAGMGLRALARGPETMTRQPPAHPGIASPWPHSSVLSSPGWTPVGGTPAMRTWTQGALGRRPAARMWPAWARPGSGGSCRETSSRPRPHASCEGWT